MQLNFIVTALAALVPLILGFIWYNPKFLGTMWMESSGMTMERAKGVNMPLVLGLSFLFSFMVALAMNSVVIHQFAFYSILIGEPGLEDPNSSVGMMVTDFMAKYGQNYRTFKHGALHGFITGLFLALPIIGTLALFERKTFKYIAINTGYWTLSFMLMGGIICAFA